MPSDEANPSGRVGIITPPIPDPAVIDVVDRLIELEAEQLPSMRLMVEGELVEVEFTMAGSIAVERKFGANGFTEHPQEASMYMAWHTLGSPGGPDGFDNWCEKVKPVAGRPVNPLVAAAPSSELSPPSL